MTMTRRDRHLHIIDGWGPGSSTYRFYRDQVVAQLGLSAFTDQAIEMIASEMVRGKRRQDRYNRENRARVRASSRSDSAIPGVG